MNASEQIDKHIADLGDWRVELISRLRKLIHEADPEITEEWKWNTPVFSHKGMVCAVGAFKDHVKINFFKGATLPDPHSLLNAGFESKLHRAIDFSEGDKINEAALKDLVREAAGLNSSWK